MPKTHKEHSYILKPTGEGQFDVLKITYSDEGILDETVYHMSKESCTCKAFELHGHCKHQDMIFSADWKSKPAGIPVRDAQAYVRGWVKELQDDWGRVWLPDEPYVRNKAEKVVEIHINVSRPKSETKVKPGTWSGRIKEIGIIGVLHVL